GPDEIPGNKGKNPGNAKDQRPAERVRCIAMFDLVERRPIIHRDGGPQLLGVDEQDQGVGVVCGRARPREMGDDERIGTLGEDLRCDARAFRGAGSGMRSMRDDSSHATPRKLRRAYQLTVSPRRRDSVSISNRLYSRAVEALASRSL